MNRRRFLWIFLLATVAGLSCPAVRADEAIPTPTPTLEIATFATEGGAQCRVARPAGKWNGKLLITAHGTIPAERSELVASLNTDNPLFSRLLAQGWTVATTSYRRNGTILTDAAADIELLRVQVAARYGKPDTVIVLGASMGGFIAALLAEHPPDPSYRGMLALGAALQAREPGEHPAALDARPTVPLLLLSTRDEVKGVNDYAARAEENGAHGPAVWTVARDGHVNLNKAEINTAFDALLAWIDGGKIELRRDATQLPAPRAPTVVFSADGTSATGKVTAVDATYGNLTIDFRPEDFTRLGLQQGDKATVRIGPAGTAERTILFGKTFWDVPAGDWVCFLTAEGDILVSRNHENAATSAHAAVGTEVTVSKAGR